MTAAIQLAACNINEIENDSTAVPTDFFLLCTGGEYSFWKADSDESILEGTLNGLDTLLLCRNATFDILKFTFVKEDFNRPDTVAIPYSVILDQKHPDD